MSFSDFFYAVISNYFYPFKILTKVNEIIKGGFNRRKFLSYSFFIYLFSLASLIVSRYIFQGGNIHLVNYSFIISIFLDLFYIFISFSIFHFFRIKVDFENFSILYFLSSYVYFILLPVTIILVSLLQENARFILNLVFFGLSILIFVMKIYVYSLAAGSSKEKGFLYYILPYLFIFLFVIFGIVGFFVSLFSLF